jgi:PAS domain-containing protein
MLKRSTPYFQVPELLEHYWTPLFDQWNECILMVDQSLSIYKSNQSWQRFMESEIEGSVNHFDRNLTTYLYPEDVFQLKQLLLKGKPIERYRIRLMNPQHQLFWFELSATVLPIETSSQYWCLQCSDQTQNIQQQYLQAAQQRSLTDLLYRLPIMLYRSRNDRDWTMEYVSRGCESITGYPTKALLNTPLYGQMIHPDDAEQVWAQVQSAIQNKNMFFLNYRIIQADQEIAQVQEIGQGVYSDSDMVLGIEGVIFPSVINPLVIVHQNN